jgi:hypothetical protein
VLANVKNGSSKISGPICGLGATVRDNLDPGSSKALGSKVFLVIHTVPNRKQSDFHTLQRGDIEIRLTVILAANETATLLLVQL